MARLAPFSKLAGLAKDAERSLLDALNGILTEVYGSLPEQPITALAQLSYSARVNDVARVKAGGKLSLPGANASTAGKRVTLIVEADGLVSVTAKAASVSGGTRQGLVNGLSTDFVVGPGQTVFVSNGSGEWFSASASGSRFYLDSDLIDVDLSTPGFVRWLHTDFPEGSFLAQNLDIGTAQPRHVLLADFAAGGLTYSLSVNNATAPFPFEVAIPSTVAQQSFAAATSISVTLPTLFQAISNPTGRRTGDRIVLQIQNDTNLFGAPNVTTPAGWTSVTTGVGGSCSLVVIERILDGSEAATLTVSDAGAGAAAWRLRLSLVRDGHAALPSTGASRSITLAATTTDMPVLVPNEGEANCLVFVGLGLDALSTITDFPDGFAVTGQLSTLGFGVTPQRTGMVQATSWTHGSTGRAAVVWTVPPQPAGVFSADALGAPLASSLFGNLFDYVQDNRAWSIANLMGVGLAPSSAIANGPSPTRVGTQLTLGFPDALATQTIPLPPVEDKQGVLITVTTARDRTITTPGTWTLVLSQNTTGGRQATYWRYIDGTEPPTIPIVMSGISPIIVQYDVFADAHPTLPPEAVGATLAVAGAALNVGNLTPSWGIADTFWLHKLSMANDDSSGFSFPLPSGQGTFQLTGGATVDCELVFCEQQLRATNLDPANQTWVTNGQACAQVIAIPPSSVTVIDVDNLPLTAMEDVATDTFAANVTGGPAPFSAEPLANLRGIGMTRVGIALTPRLRPRKAQVQDYFMSGNTTSGSIGALGWNLLGTGTPSYIRGNATVMGASSRGEITTSAVANDRTVLTLGETETRDIIPPTDLDFLQCVVNQDATLTSKRFFFGLMGTFATEPATAVDCLGIYYDSAVSPNYQIIARAGSAGSPTNTGVAVPSATAELLTILRLADDSYEFYSGNTLLGTISAGVADATAMNVGFRVETLTAAARHVNVGYFGMSARASAAFDDDAFLEV